MKKMILVALTGCAFAVAANAGGVWSMIKNTQSDGKIQTKQYEIEVAGTNIRGYVFEVPEMKSVCVNIFTDKSQTLECKTYKEMGEN